MLLKIFLTLHPDIHVYEATSSINFDCHIQLHGAHYTTAKNLTDNDLFLSPVCPAADTV